MGDKARFWSDCWVGQQSLASKYPRLFLNSSQKEATIANMGYWKGGQCYWNFTWHRGWFEWEQNLFDRLVEEVEGIPLQKEVMDSWRWGYCNYWVL